MAKQTKQKDSFKSQRSPRKELDGSFRRNNVVVSKSQRELKAHQESVTQRQFDLKRFRAKQSRRKRIQLILIATGLVLLALQLRVGDISVVTAKGFSLPENQQKFYQEKLEALVPRHTSFGQSWLLDSDGLSRQLIKDLPEVKSIKPESKAPFSRELVVHMTFRTPEFTWTDASEKRQYVDGQGVLFAKNYVAGLTESNLVHIEDQSGAVLDTGSSVLTRDLISFVGRLPEQLRKVLGRDNAEVERVIIPQSIREVRFKIKGDKYEVRFDSTRPLEEQVRDLRLIKNNLRQKGISPRSYIDLRVENKAFYK